MKNEYQGDPLPFTFKTFLLEDQPSTFPKDAVEGILLSLKETAECCNLDNLMEVCRIFALDESIFKMLCFKLLF